GQSYRVAGWIHTLSGRARVGMDVLDGTGATIESGVAPWVSPGKSWQYTAVERDMNPRAAQIRIWMEADGAARLDDVSLCSMTGNLVYNPAFDADSRNRIGMWGEEPAALLPGKRAGSQAAAPAAGRTGAALQLTAMGTDWWGSRVVPAVLPPGIRTYRF